MALWGKFAESFDGDTLHEWSKNEPVVILFVGVMVDQYAGTLAFKNTSPSRWHINVNIPEMKAMVERTTGMPYQIEL